MGIETPVLLNRVTGSAFQGKCGLTEAFPKITTRIFFQRPQNIYSSRQGLGVNDFQELTLMLLHRYSQTDEVTSVGNEQIQAHQIFKSKHVFLLLLPCHLDHSMARFNACRNHWHHHRHETWPLLNTEKLSYVVHQEKTLFA